MKKWIVRLVVAALLVLILPVGLGELAKKSIRSRVANLNLIQEKSQQGPKFRLEITDYQQGWFRSKAKLAVYFKKASLAPIIQQQLAPMLNLSPQKAESGLLQLESDLTIIHGPIIVQHNNPNVATLQFGLGFVENILSLPWNEQTQQRIKAILGHEKIVMSSTLISYFGAFSSEINLPKVHYTDAASDIKVDWDGLSLSSQMSKDLKDANLKLHVAPIKISHLNGVKVFDAAALSVLGDARQGSYGIWSGNFNLKMANLEFSKEGAPEFALMGVEAVSAVNVDDDALSVSVNYQVYNIFTNGKSYGPSSLLFQLSGLGAKQYKSLTDKLNDLDLQAMPEHQLALLSLQLLPEFTRMLYGTSLAIVFNTKAPEGDIEFTLRMDLPPKNSLIGDITKLIEDTKGQCAYSMPREILKRMLASEAEIALNTEIMAAAKERGELPDLSSVQLMADSAAEEHLAALQREGWISISDGLVSGNYLYKSGKILSGNKVLFDIMGLLQAALR